MVGGRRLHVLVVGVALLAVLSGCTAALGEPSPGYAPAASESSATLAASIPHDARDVAPGDPLVITADSGRLTSIEVTANGGAPLLGQLNPTGTRWVSTPLPWGTTYEVHAEGTGPGGAAATPLDSRFQTVAAPEQTLEIDRITPEPGAVVGVAMPVSIYFDRPVTDRAAVERRLAVHASVPVDGSFHWFSDERVNWRPREYWPAGTQVTVQADLYGVHVGDGVYGTRNTSVPFGIGADRRVFGDVNTHRLIAYENGVEVRNMPASYGRSIYPTQFGIHVAFEKYEIKRMRSDTWGGPAEGEPGFYDELLPNAVRISNNGEFVHINAATTWAQGEQNVSHGCVNLSPTDGAWFYDWIQFGDPVEIVGSSRPLTPADGDIADWTIPWEQYVQGSALPRAPAGQGAPELPIDLIAER